MIRFLVAATQFVAIAALADGPQLQNFCSRFKGNDCDVSWATPPNQLPTSVRILKVTPTKFSPTAVSNLLEIAELKPDQSKRVDQTGVFAGKDVQFFADRNATRQLNLVPSQGLIAISKDGVYAQIPKQLPVGVPDDQDALRLTLAILEKIGIGRAELAGNPGADTPQSSFSEAIVMHKDKSSGQVISNVVRRTIYLTRQIEGIPFWGDAGVTARFGNEGKLAYLSVVWRAVEPDRNCPVPDPEEFVTRIRSGRALIRNEQAGAAYRRLTVEKVSLYYWENSGSEPQSHIYPFAVLDAKTDLQGDNSKIQLFVPFAND